MMFDTFESYDVQETRRISREEGRIEGEQLYLIKQIIVVDLINYQNTDLLACL